MTVIDQTVGEHFALYNGDTVDVAKGLPDHSVGCSVFSPPFEGLYTYSASPRDFGNCQTSAEFWEHYQYLLNETARVMKPGRLVCVHCMDLPTSKVRDGMIGLRDFPGEIVRHYVAAGFIFHSRFTIFKDPVQAMQRTKAIGLLHKQLKKDSTMSRAGIPDMVLVFRTPGENDSPVAHTPEDFPVDEWQKIASPIWMDIDPGDTLQHRSAREDEDEKHIAPLQLEVIRRCLRLYSNPGDVVWSPFAGIGSEGVVAIEMGRRFVGAELKRSYYEQAARNLKAATPEGKAQPTLFDVMAAGEALADPVLAGLSEPVEIDSLDAAFAVLGEVKGGT